MNSESIRRLPVFDISGAHAFWCDEDQARALLREGKCRLIRRRGHARALHAVAGLPRCDELLAGRGTGFHAQRYSHKNESEDNVRNCWTLRRLAESARPAFERVVAECTR